MKMTHFFTKSTSGVLFLLLFSPALHAASAGAPPEEDASHWFEGLDETSPPSEFAPVQEQGTRSSVERIFAGSLLSARISAGSSSTLDQNLAATLSVFEFADSNIWYAFNHPGAGLLARRFGGGVGVRPGPRTRLAFDYEHALPENQFGANLFWLSWSANVAPGRRLSRITGSLGRLNFTDNSSAPLVNQTAIKIGLLQDVTDRLSFSGTYIFYSDPHGPVEASDKIRLLQLAISTRAVTIDLEKPKTYEADLNARYVFDEANELLFDASVVHYFAAVAANQEAAIYTPGLTYTRSFGKHFAIDASAVISTQAGQPANPSFGLQTTLVL